MRSVKARVGGKVVTFRDRPAPRRARGPSLSRWRLGPLAVPLLLLGVGVIGAGIGLATSPWPIDITIRHWMAAPSCAAARAVGLAPSYRGQPGYYLQHDADGDGIACEAWSRR